MILGIAVLVVFYDFIREVILSIFLFTKLPVRLKTCSEGTDDAGMARHFFGFDSVFFATDLANSYCNL